MSKMSTQDIPMNKIDETTWEVPMSYKKGMRVPARIIVTPKLKSGIEHRVVDQITNVATLPGIQKYAIALPDAHAGYGFPIGGVAAFDMEEGVISPGGVGFDINCLPKGTEILSNLGYTMGIEEYESKWKQEGLITIDFDNLIHEDTRINRFIKIKANSLFRLSVITIKPGYKNKSPPFAFSNFKASNSVFIKSSADFRYFTLVRVIDLLAEERSLTLSTACSVVISQIIRQSISSSKLFLSTR